MRNEEHLLELIMALADSEMPGTEGAGREGEDMQVVFVEHEHARSSPEHAHPARWEFVLAGEVTVVAGGRRTSYRAGDNFVIGSGVPHAETFSPGYKSILVLDPQDNDGRE